MAVLTRWPFCHFSNSVTDLWNNLFACTCFRPDVLKNEMKVFFVKYNDPIYVKLEKLDIMIRLTNHSNIAQVLAELKELVMPCSWWGVDIVCIIHGVVTRYTVTHRYWFWCTYCDCIYWLYNWKLWLLSNKLLNMNDIKIYCCVTMFSDMQLKLMLTSCASRCVLSAVVLSR